MDTDKWQSAYLTCSKPWVPFPALQKTANICLNEKKKRWAGDLRRLQKAHENDPEKWVI